MQPRLEWTSEKRVRDDAEAIIVLDTSRSMLARSSPKSEIRFTRATEAALRFRSAFGDVPMGIASFTDRVLPHLFPSSDDDVFVATLNRSLGIDRPPPHGSFVSTATRLAALEAIVSRRFFTPTARKRLIFVITDGESVPISGAKIAAAFRRPPGVDTIFLHVGTVTSASSTAASRSRSTAPTRARAASSTAPPTRSAARSSPRASSTDAIAAAGNALGDGTTVVQGEKRNRIALAPYLAGAVFLPLALLLWRRDR